MMKMAILPKGISEAVMPAVFWLFEITVISIKIAKFAETTDHAIQNSCSYSPK
jgi:hypothetical protein